MDSIVIQGGTPLHGTIEISGAKNAALPIMAASILSDNELILDNVPNLTDISTMASLLEKLGVKCSRNKNRVTLLADKINNLVAPYEMVRKMRASIWVLGPLVARFGTAKVSLPGGCALGARLVDLHIAGLEAMGAKINIEDGYIIAEANSGLKGVHFSFNKISVGATVTMIMAAVLAKGQTLLNNAAREPEITNLCHCLVGMGAKIQGIGTDQITIDGVNSLSKFTQAIIPDRIEAGTYMIAAGITRGELLLKNIDYPLVENICLKLAETGMDLTEVPEGILVKAGNGLNAADMSTMPFPGFPTDLQAQYMALVALANGTSVITENIFENRFMHVPELCRMGAHITISSNNAIIRGISQYTGAEVMASDLRASVSLILAGLAGNKETKVRRVYHLDRGYDSLEAKLRNCGANITRITGDTV